jgi:lysophospholipase L1-like esterase
MHSIDDQLIDHHDRSMISRGRVTNRGCIRLWILRLLLVVVGFMPITICEVVLRLLPISPPANYDPFLDLSLTSPLFIESDSDWSIPKERQRLFSPASFVKNKSTKSKRIFCIGGSTTQGEPYKPPTAFPKWLEINLKLAAPDWNWEVINVGGLSYASYRMLPIVYEILEHEADLVIIELGHNEFLEKRELSGWNNTVLGASELSFCLRSLRTIQMANSFTGLFLSKPPNSNRTKLEHEVNALLDHQGGLSQYELVSLDRLGTVRSMVWNLERMIDACRMSNIPIVVLGPTTNILDCPPFKSEVDPLLAHDTKVALEDLIQTTIKKLQKRNDSEQDTSHAFWEYVLSIDPGYASGLYAKGQYCLGNGEFEEARRYLELARDSDVCPLRATSTIQSAIQTTARTLNAWFLNVDDIMKSRSKHGIVGNSCLIDHVHPRVEGHQWIGEAIAELLIERQWIEPVDSSWKGARAFVYSTHLATLGEDYFIRGKQRLEGLELWANGRVRKYDANSFLDEDRPTESQVLP